MSQKFLDKLIIRFKELCNKKLGKGEVKQMPNGLYYFKNKNHYLLFGGKIHTRYYLEYIPFEEIFEPSVDAVEYLIDVYLNKARVFESIGALKNELESLQKQYRLSKNGLKKTFANEELYIRFVHPETKKLHIQKIDLDVLLDELFKEKANVK